MLASNYADRLNPLLLACTEEGVLRTTDKGLTRVEVLPLASGAGPVAFSQSHVELAYTIARDGTAYRSTDFGATWTPGAVLRLPSAPRG